LRLGPRLAAHQARKAAPRAVVFILEALLDIGPRGIKIETGVVVEENPRRGLSAAACTPVRLVRQRMEVNPIIDEF